MKKSIFTSKKTKIKPLSTFRSIDSFSNWSLSDIDQFQLTENQNRLNSRHFDETIWPWVIDKWNIVVLIVIKWSRIVVSHLNNSWWRWSFLFGSWRSTDDGFEWRDLNQWKSNSMKIEFNQRTALLDENCDCRSLLICSDFSGRRSWSFFLKFFSFRRLIERRKKNVQRIWK